jgi:hypothetical protein
LGLAGLIVVLLVIDSTTREMLIRENGPIELLSAIGYFVCLIPLLRHGVEDSKSQLLMAFFLLILGMRELDFHARFTAMELTKIKFYLSSNVPIMEKAIGAAIILLFAYCIMSLSKEYFLAYVGAVKQLEPYAIGVSLAFLFLMISLGLDGFEKKAATLGFAITSDVSDIMIVVEEVIEFGIPIMFLIAIMSYHKQLKN